MARYAEAEDLEKYLDQLDASDPEDEALMNAALDRATDIVDEALGARPGENFFNGYTSATDKIVRSQWGEYFVIPAHDIGSVTEIQTAGGDVVDTDMWRELDSGVLYGANSSGIPYGWGYAEYTITADWGRGDAPASVVEVVLEVAVNIHRAKDKGGFTELIGNPTEGGKTAKFIAGLTHAQRKILENARARVSTVTV